jgi:structural maintenance of chromosome 4
MQKSLEPWNEKINQRLSAIAVAESELSILYEKANASAVAFKEVKGKIVSIEEGRSAKLAQLEEIRAEKSKLEKVSSGRSNRKAI